MSFETLPHPSTTPVLQSERPDEEPDRLNSRVFQLDPGKDTWTEGANMRYSRYRCGVATLNGEIYMLG